MSAWFSGVADAVKGQVARLSTGGEEKKEASESRGAEGEETEKKEEDEEEEESREAPVSPWRFIADKASGFASVFADAEEAGAPGGEDGAQELPVWHVEEESGLKEREALIRMQVLNLSEEKSVFLEPPAQELLAGFHFDMEARAAQAQRCLAADPQLEKMRWVLVPWKVKEEPFWRNYFAHVHVIREALLTQKIDAGALERAKAEEHRPREGTRDLLRKEEQQEEEERGVAEVEAEAEETSLLPQLSGVELELHELDLEGELDLDDLDLDGDLGDLGDTSGLDLEQQIEDALNDF